MGGMRPARRGARSEQLSRQRRRMRTPQPVKTQRSSGVTVTVRILPALAESISKTVTGEKTLLISSLNRSFAVKGFGNWFRDRCDEAGVPGSAHGLRKAAAARCAENGATASELMAMFGWTTLQEAERYTRAAERKWLGLRGSERLHAPD